MRHCVMVLTVQHSVDRWLLSGWSVVIAKFLFNCSWWCWRTNCNEDNQNCRKISVCSRFV